MLAILKRALYEEAYFAQWIRTIFGAIYIAYETGLFPTALENSVTWYVSKALLVIALFIRAGEKNSGGTSADGRG